jgi:TPR repeat protein
VKAYELYERACRFGQGIRCLRAGVMVLNGRGAAQSVPKAAELFQLGCRFLEPDSCVNYYAVTHGKMIDWAGNTVPMPGGMLPAKADPGTLHGVVSVLTIACTKGIAKACGNLAGIIEEGDATPRDLAKALEYYTKACDLGEAERCARAGRYVANNVPEPSVMKEKAAKLFDRYCELKKLATCPLAHKARTGIKIELTLAEAPAQPAHSAPPEAVVGSNPLPSDAPSGESSQPPVAPLALEPRKMADAPKNTPPWARYPVDQAVLNEALSAEQQIMVKKCNQGDGRACGNAAAALVDDSGKPKLWPETARQLFERACALGRAQRCADLARMHAHGWGTEKSPEREKAAIAEACRKGHKPSCVPVQPAKEAKTDGGAAK